MFDSSVLRSSGVRTFILFLSPCLTQTLYKPSHLLEGSGGSLDYDMPIQPRRRLSVGYPTPCPGVQRALSASVLAPRPRHLLVLASSACSRSRSPSWSNYTPRSD